jgi:hypothetical protein
MASTYSALKIELIATGEQSGTWGATTDTNLDVALGEAITGSADVNYATAADVTLTLVDTNTAQTARNLRLNITESSTGVGYVGNLVLGSGCQIEKFYIINNGSTGAKTVKNTTGTGISVPAGKTMVVFNNGTNVVDAISYLASLTTPSATITGGTINGTTIGATTASTGAFTTLTGTTGSFTTLSASGDVSFTSTGALQIPAGTTGQRVSNPVNGDIRYNTTTVQYEGFTTVAAQTTISTLTNATTTATATTVANHNLQTGNYLTITGCTPAAYNGSFSITVTGATTFTYTMLTNPGGSATVVGTYTTGIWTQIGGGATGGGSNQVFVLNDQTVTADYTIPTGKNASSAGPITIDTGVTVTVPDNSTWVIV